MQRYLYLLILSLLLLVGQANAEDISIHGRVVDNPCTIDVDTESKQIYLGRPGVGDLKIAGLGTRWVNFELLLIDCPGSLSSVTATFSGEEDVNDARAFKNLGASRNVALQMTNSDHSVIYGNASQKVVALDISTLRAIFPLSARIISPLGNATIGSFNAVVNVDFTYQ